ncbi:MAG TPA: GGDEF domain-containing protein [Burkholderiales bacterium]|nr:GGDEF domain-containing protein [Burkholderiales bacterium]
MESTSPVETGEDPLAPYRGRILYGLASAAAVCLLPFSVNAFVQGNPGLGAGILCAFLILAIDALFIYLKRSPPIPLILLLVPIAAGMAISLKVQGFFGALWCYPTVLLFTFALSRRMASVGSILLLLIVSALVYRYIDLAYTIRFFVTLTLTIILANIVLSIIVDLHRRLLEQAIVDPLTGVFNRRHMERYLSDAVERKRRNSAPASLMLIDVDRFKLINDRFGHAKGDSVLKGIVSLVGKRARKVDLLFRIGGEEFILLLPDTEEAAAAVVAEQLRASIAGAPLVDGRQVTVSIGVSELQPGESPDSWMKHADDALYAAKKAGRNRVVCAGTLQSREDPTPLNAESET